MTKFPILLKMSKDSYRISSYIFTNKIDDTDIRMQIYSSIKTENLKAEIQSVRFIILSLLIIQLRLLKNQKQRKYYSPKISKSCHF